MLLFGGACAPRIARTTDPPPTATTLTELWVEPGDIPSRDLFYGPGGAGGVPSPTTRFKVTGLDRTGNSPGYDVLAADGRRWRAKLGEEVQPEIVASRLLWAIGFHQPAMYLVTNLQLDGGRPDDSGVITRLRAETGYRTESDWSWHQNPFVGTRQLNGLLVAQLILNNWDLKTSQNRIYVMEEGEPLRRYVVQDLGAALGKTRWPTGTRGRIDDFEQHQLIARIQGSRVIFDYHARHRELFEQITAADVAWTARLLSKLTDRQWQDAFRAARYPQPVSRRFIAKLNAKVREGLALEPGAASTR